ncbi:MAG: hypothetical protein M1821_001525 [Bathelium mastoideum]|nr:MAG: hypothetical protein M1821_001525 [Bathelium mastoideum]
MNHDLSSASTTQSVAAGSSNVTAATSQSESQLKTQVPPRTSSRGSRDRRPSKEPSIEQRSAATSYQTASTGDQAAMQLESSRSGAQPRTTEEPSNLSGATVNDGESIGKQSKRSLRGRRRAGSKGSSKPIQQPAGEKISEPQQPTAPPTTEAVNKASHKKPSFFRRLLCCVAPSESQTLESGEAIPNAKKTNKLRSGRSPQPPPKDSKQDPSNAESSTADSKEPLDEKAVGPTNAQPDKAGMLDSHAGPPGDGVMDSKTSEQPSDAAGGSQVRPIDQQQAPPQPPMLDTSPSTLQGASQLHAAPTLSVTEATPVIAQQEQELISDRTPEQAQTDQEIETSIPIAQNEVAPSHDQIGNSAQRDPSPPKIPLPPPPPLEERQAATVPPVPVVPEPVTMAHPEQQKYLLPPIRPEMRGRKCLVLDLDETLVHSSFKILHQADFTIPVEIEGQYHNVYVIKRPGVDAFMKRVGELYEVVVFTASVAKYGDPLLDQLDIHHVVHHRLFRESCYNHQGNYVKDLSQVGRDLQKTIIIDNSPTSYIFHPQHAVPISSWFSDAHDNELLDLIPVLEDLAESNVNDVSLVLDVAL